MGRQAEERKQPADRPSEQSPPTEQPAEKTTAVQLQDDDVHMRDAAPLTEEAPSAPSHSTDAAALPTDASASSQASSSPSSPPQQLHPALRALSSLLSTLGARSDAGLAVQAGAFRSSLPRVLPAPLVTDQQIARATVSMALVWGGAAPTPTPAAEPVPADATAAPSVTLPAFPSVDAVNPTLRTACAQLLLAHVRDAGAADAICQALDGAMLARCVPAGVEWLREAGAARRITFLSSILRFLSPLLSADASAERCNALGIALASIVPAPPPPLDVQRALLALWRSGVSAPTPLRAAVATRWLPPLGAAPQGSPEAKLRGELLDWIKSTLRTGGMKTPAAALVPAAASAASNLALTAPGQPLPLRRRMIGVRAGLQNVSGASCYLNATLQCLYATDALRLAVLAVDRVRHFSLLRRRLPLLHVQTAFAFLAATHRDAFAPRALLASLPASFAPESAVQQDAGEFAKYVLDEVGAGLREYKRKLTEDAAGGAQQTSTNTSPSTAPLFNGNNAATAASSFSTSAASSSVASSSASTSSSAASSSSSFADAPMSTATSSPLPASPSPASVERRTHAMDIDSGMRGGAAQPQHTPPAPVRAAVEAANSVQDAVSSLSVQLVPPPSTSGASPRAAPASSSASSSGAAPPIDMSADEYFGGELQSCIECLHCGTRSVKSEAFLELPLALEIERVAAPTVTPAASSTATAASSTLAQSSSSSSLSAASSILTAFATATAPAPSAPVAEATASASATATANATAPNNDRVLNILAGFLGEEPAEPVPQQLQEQQPKHGANGSDSEQPTKKARSELTAIPPSTAPATSTPSVTAAATPAMSPDAIAAFTASCMLTLAASQFASAAASSTLAAAAAAAAASSAAAPPADSVPSSSSSSALTASAATESSPSESAVAAVEPAVTASTAPLASSNAAASPATTASNSTAASSSALPSAASKSTSSSTAATPPSSAATSKASLPGAVGEQWVVPSDPSPLALSALLKHYFSSETLAGDNAVSCTRCGVKRSSSKTLRISRPPAHLLLCLKRNKFTIGAGGLVVRSKIMKEVTFPALLKLPVHQSAESEAQANTQSKALDEKQGASENVAASSKFKSYVLYGCIVHAGLSSQHGHYYAYARHSDAHALSSLAPFWKRGEGSLSDDQSPTVSDLVERAAQGAPGSEGGWFCANDSVVRDASFDELRKVTQQCASDVAYLLFYRALDALDDPNTKLERDDDPGLPLAHTLLAPALLRPVHADNEAYVREQQLAAQLVRKSTHMRCMCCCYGCDPFVCLLQDVTHWRFSLLAPPVCCPIAQSAVKPLILPKLQSYAHTQANPPTDADYDADMM